MSPLLRLSAVALGALSVFAFVPVAHAGLDACGNIDIDVNARCKVSIDAPCTVQCTPLSFDVQCAAKLEVGCEAICNKPPEVSCTDNCQGGCETECNVNPGTFDCEGSCTGDCQGTCTGKCSAASDGASCEAACKASCSADCHASCTGTPPTADCAGQCQLKCQGSCTADLNMDCQTMCQVGGFADCQTNLMGGCTAACHDPKGALFCDGQFIDVGNQLSDCITALDDYLKEHVDVSATASGSCTSNSSGSECSGEASATASCHCSTPSSGDRSNTAPLVIAGLAGIMVLSRRRASRSGSDSRPGRLRR